MKNRRDITYKRLPGRGPRKVGMIGALMSRCSLHLGEDHILAVDSNGFSEDYKRFYFTDIQGFITRRTRTGFAWNIALGLMIACSVTGALFLEKEALCIFFWILSGVFLIFLLINLFRGPTCICHILTAVQEEPLPSLNRLCVAQKVIETLRGTIEKAQATLVPEELGAQESGEVQSPAPSVQLLRNPRTVKKLLRHDGGMVHGIAFTLILLDGVLTGSLLFHHTAAMSAVSSVLTLLWSVIIIIALVRQHDSDLPSSVRRMTWASLGFLCLSYFLAYILLVTTLVANVHQQMQVTTNLDLYRMMLNVSPQSSLFHMAVYAFSAVVSFALGILGLLRLKKHRDESIRLPGFGRNPASEMPS